MSPKEIVKWQSGSRTYRLVETHGKINNRTFQNFHIEQRNYDLMGGDMWLLEVSIDAFGKVIAGEAKPKLMLVLIELLKRNQEPPKEGPYR